MNDPIAQMITLNAEHARLWFTFHNALTQAHADTHPLYHYPAVFTWAAAIVDMRRMQAEGNMRGVIWMLERSREVNVALQEKIDAIYAGMTAPEDMR